MNLQAFFTLWQDVGLILYAILKAFLPLPSLEVVLTPLCLKHPEKWLLYSFEGAIGTCIGGAIGYGIAYSVGRKALAHIASDEDIEKGETLMDCLLCSSEVLRQSLISYWLIWLALPKCLFFPLRCVMAWLDFYAVSS